MKYWMEVSITETSRSNRRRYNVSIDESLSAWVDVDPSEVTDAWAERWFKAAYWAQVGDDATPENRPHEGDDEQTSYCLLVYPAVPPEEDVNETGYAEEFVAGYDSDEWELWEERFGDDDIVIDVCGHKYKFNEISPLMDGEILNSLAASILMPTNQRLFDAYCDEYRDTHEEEEYSDGKWVYYADFTRKLYEIIGWNDSAHLRMGFLRIRKKEEMKKKISSSPRFRGARASGSSSALAQMRIKSGMTQQQLGAKVGASGNLIKAWEKGAPIKPEYWGNLCAALGVEPETLAAIAGNPANAAEMRAEFVEGLKKARYERGYSQAGLARALQVSRETVSQWEKGTMMPAPEKQAALNQLLGYPATVTKRPKASGTERPKEKKKAEKSKAVVQNPDDPRIGITGRMRLDAGLTLAELSARTNNAACYLSRIERNPIVPHDDTILAVARACGVLAEDYGFRPTAPKEYPYAALGKKLYQLRAAKGYAQQDVVRLTGVTTYVYAEQGRFAPRPANLAKIAAVLDCPLGELETLKNRK